MNTRIFYFALIKLQANTNKFAVLWKFCIVRFLWNTALPYEAARCAMKRTCGAWSEAWRLHIFWAAGVSIVQISVQNASRSGVLRHRNNCGGLGSNGYCNQSELIVIGFIWYFVSLYWQMQSKLFWFPGKDFPAVQIQQLGECWFCSTATASNLFHWLLSRQFAAWK